MFLHDNNNLQPDWAITMNNTTSELFKCPRSITNHSLVLTSGYISNKNSYTIIPLNGSNNNILTSYIITTVLRLIPSNLCG